MESLGEYLRRQRELKGFSLRDLSEKTKIGINYLKYIEENRFEKIPGNVFVKGFLRLYANSVGLKEEDVLGIYHDQYERKEKENEKKEDTGQKLVTEKHRRLPLWLLVIPILVIAFFLFKGIPQKKKNLPPPAPPKQVKELIKPEPPPVVSGGIPKDLTLSIEATEETWVKIIIDGMEVKESLLRSGDEVSFTAKKNFGLTIGNAGGVKISFDGKEVEPLGPHGRVIRNLVLSREGKTSSSPLRGED
jgi:transcriptional regulator with XRE-family HTH domain